MRQIVLGVDGMNLEDLVAVAKQGAGVRLEKGRGSGLSSAGPLVEQWLREGRITYGVTTASGR